MKIIEIHTFILFKTILVLQGRPMTKNQIAEFIKD